MLNYDTEATRYDETRGGEPRARAAAGAVLSVLPAAARTLLDVGCGTGLVMTHLRRPGLRCVGADRSPGMLALAATRLGPGHVVLADSRALPFATASVDAVSMIWLLHLVTGVETVLAEAARVLAPGGTLITTVDKDAAQDGSGDIGDLIRPFRRSGATDAFDTIREWGESHGLGYVGETTFIGHGQGRTPAQATTHIHAGHLPSAVRLTVPQRQRLIGALEALPDQATHRPDPVYRLLTLRKS